MLVVFIDCICRESAEWTPITVVVAAAAAVFVVREAKKLRTGKRITNDAKKIELILLRTPKLDWFET